MRRKLASEVGLTRLLLGATLVASLLLSADVFSVLHARLRAGSLTGVAEQGVFIAIVYALLLGNLVYQLARIGHLERQRRHRRVARETLEQVYERPAPPLVVLVPSYREEYRIVRQTLLSAALQEYPDRRVVLLIDDPPDPSDPAGLRAARQLPEEICSLLEKPASHLSEALADCLERRSRGRLDLREETRRLAGLYLQAAAWFESRATAEPESDHSDRLFVRLVLDQPARAHRKRAAELEAAATHGGLGGERRVLREYRRLAALFRVEVTSFERKRYANLSHEPNKAMNLNSYLGLLGGGYRAVRGETGLRLEPTAGDAELVIPDAEYVITLDADSLLTHDYALQLAHFMGEPGNERVAVAQTPYSAFPDAPGVLERAAGATTDIQHVIHQGFTQHGATFWVGANALLRKSALDDLRVVEREQDLEVAKFIQDRTLIEDTESSVDLIARGWSLYNHPERLAYSATPPDFGSLLIQRRRWANGGLLILPKLLRYLTRPAPRLPALGEALMRVHYLASIAAVNLGLLVLLLYPFEESMRELWWPLTAAPYFLLYARDLVQSGYRAGDVVRVYALNLLLLPVNLAGVFKSLQQGWSGRKLPFGRTPKVTSRTRAPRFYLLAEYALLGALAVTLVLDVGFGRWTHAAFVAVNGGLLAYAVVRFVGLRESLEDLGLRAVPERSAVPARAGVAESG